MADLWAVRVTDKQTKSTTFLAYNMAEVCVFTKPEWAEKYADRFRESFGATSQYDVLPVEMDPI